MRIVLLVFLMIVGGLAIAMGVYALRDAMRPIPDQPTFLRGAFKASRTMGVLFGVVALGLGGGLAIFCMYSLIVGE